MTNVEIFEKDMKHNNKYTWLHHQLYPGSNNGMLFVCHLKCHESGDMKSYDDASYKGEYELNDNYRRHWCGYVGVPKGHEYFGSGICSASECDGKIHEVEGHVNGGFTWSNHFDEWGDKFWFIGFDCSHSMDITEWSDMVRRDKNPEEFKNGYDEHAEFKTKEYAEGVVNDLLRNLIIQFHNNLEE